MVNTVWVTGDQCSFQNTALAASNRESTIVLLIESIDRGHMPKYHKKKLVLIYSRMRHFAQELDDAGWKVDYYREHASFNDAVQQHIKKHQPKALWMMEQSEFGMN